MDRKTQDLAWSILPKEFREEVKYEYSRVATKAIKSSYDLGFMNAHEGMYGIHNLASDAEGAEMLTISRKQVQEMYSAFKDFKNKDNTCFNLETLFGSECLPDACNVASNVTSNVASNEPKPVEPKFKEGNIVRYRYDGKLYIVVCKTGKYHYALRQYDCDIMIHDALESELEPYTEPKAPKIKVGDRVRCKNPIRLASSTDNDFIGIVTDAVTDGENGWFNVRMNKGATFQTYYESDLELIEPAEQTHQRATIISEGDIHSLDETPTNNVGSIKIPVEVDLSDSYWDAYAADLAKELALKVANKFNTPHEAAEYAVSVAKAVAEGLKRK